MELLNGPVPLYFQIAHILRKRIEDGVYGVDSRLPSEVNIAKEFAVSRMTVREAIGILKKEGIIYTKQGTGNFVNSRGTTNNKYGRITGSIEDLLSYAMETESKIIRTSVVEPSVDVQEALKLAESERVVEIVANRYAEGKLICASFINIPSSFATSLLVVPVMKKPMFRLIEETFNVSIVDVEQRISAILANKDITSLLCVKEKAPVLAMRRTYYLADGKPVEFVKAFYRADKFEYAIRLSRTWAEPRLNRIWAESS